MRLDDIDTSDVNVEDQRGRGGGGFGFPGGGGGMRLSRGMGCGTIGLIVVAALIAIPFIGLQGALALVAGLLGLGSMGGESGVSAPTQQEQVTGQGCDANQASKFSCQVLASNNATWEKAFADGGYKAPKIVFYAGGGQSGCGAAQAAMGPFYCPADQGIYLDTSFYDQLSRQFGAAGDFAQAYVIAHEVGHHLQYLTGRADAVRKAQSRANEVQGNQLQVRMELQADCYAGVWAAKNKDRLEAGDIEEGLRAARQIGDDTLQRQSQGVVVPESFTHGSSEQRMAALKLGLSSGTEDSCERFFQ